MLVEGYTVASEGLVRRVFWVDWFHRTPHLNLSFRQVNSTFNPFSSIYQESLGIIGSVPTALLILTLLALLLYLLTRCCDNKPRKSSSITCLRVTCVFFALFTLGALGVSIWGNEEVHEGVTSVIHSLNNIDSLVQTVRNKTKIFDETIQRNLQPQLNLFKETIQEKDIDNVTAQMFILENLHYIQGNISDVLIINMEDISAKLSGIGLNTVVRALSLGELARWVSTLIITALLMMIVLIVPVGVGRSSRCTLITFSVLGLISLIVCWSLTSMYLVITVAFSDWCLNPNPFLEKQLEYFVSADVAAYYLRCSPTRPSPFTRYLTHAQQAADIILTSLHEVTEVADQNYPRKQIHPRLNHIETYMKQLDGTMGDVGALLECQSIHHQYLMSVNATCYQTVCGIVYLLLSAVGSSILFTFLVWLTSHTWIYLNHKGSKSGTLNSLSGQNCPRPRHSHTPPQTPPFPGTLNGRFIVSDGVGGNPNIVPPPTVSSMGRENNHHHHHHHHHHHGHHHSLPTAPNQGQYATLSKQCKTLESSDFY